MYMNSSLSTSTQDLYCKAPHVLKRRSCTRRQASVTRHTSREALLCPRRPSLTGNSHPRLRIGGRRSMPEAEGIRHSWKKFLSCHSHSGLFVPYRWSFAETAVRAGWRVASESQSKCECRQVFRHPHLTNGPASVRGPLLKGERRV
jgi:hypothetical protein